MIDIRPAVVTLLLDDPTVAGIINGRIFPSELPQGQRDPSLVYGRITDFADYHLQGDSGLHQAHMQINAIAQTPDLSDQLARAVYDVLSGFRGTVDGVVIQGVFASNGRDLSDDTTEMKNMSRDYRFFYAAQ